MGTNMLKGKGTSIEAIPKLVVNFINDFYELSMPKDYVLKGQIIHHPTNPHLDTKIDHTFAFSFPLFQSQKRC